MHIKDLLPGLPLREAKVPSQVVPGNVPQMVAKASLHRGVGGGGGAQSLSPFKAGELGFPAPTPASHWLRATSGSEHIQLFAGGQSCSRGPGPIC